MRLWIYIFFHFPLPSERKLREMNRFFSSLSLVFALCRSRNSLSNYKHYSCIHGNPWIKALGFSRSIEFAYSTIEIVFFFYSLLTITLRLHSYNSCIVRIVDRECVCVCLYCAISALTEQRQASAGSTAATAVAATAVDDSISEKEIDWVYHGTKS